MPIAWSPRLSVNVPVLDDQHREIIRRAHDLIHAMRERRGSDELHRMLTFLRAYIRTHFAAEEALMARADYPRLREHRGEHLRLRRRLSTVSEQLDAVGPTPTLIVAVNELVCDWFFDHIAESDSAVGRYLAEAASLDGRSAASALVARLRYV